VLVNGRDRGQLQAPRQLLITGAVTVLFNEPCDEVQDFFLTSCKGHGPLWANKRRNVKG
jgi:hypothetical protein